MELDSSAFEMAFGVWEVASVILALVGSVISLGISIGSYVLQSLGLYELARRREIKYPWLAWLPVGNQWILGSLSDQYSYVAQGRIRNRRKVLIWLSAGFFLLVAAFWSVYLGWIIGVLSKLAEGAAPDLTGFAPFAWMLLFGWAFFMLFVVFAVFRYICLYKLYSSCVPESKLLCIILSILFPVSASILIFAYSKRDGGMPPRKDALPE